MSLRMSQHLRLSLMKKFIVGISGLFLCLFIVGHLAGNYLMFHSAEHFNMHAHKLITNPAIYAIEGILLLILIIHVTVASTVTIENRRARPVQYKKGTGWKMSRLAPLTMPYTGLLILLFLVWHIAGIKFGQVYHAQYDDLEVRDLFKNLIILFGNLLNVMGYGAAMLVLGVHVLHGVWSSPQSLGINQPKLDGGLRKAALLFSLIATISFITFAVWCHLQGAN